MSTPSLISSQTEPRDSTFIPRGTTRQLRSVLRQIGLLALIISGAILFLIPWAWIILTAGKDAATIFRTPPVWIPPTYHWEHFIEGWVRADFSIYYLNTLFISTMNVIAVLISCSLAAYAFARIRFPGRD
ncbi:MAG: hypothetical protein L0Y56_05975, partial [Nitrospira sp.]|nr:hypothetical protein [Nitrospira sp.]